MLKKINNKGYMLVEIILAFSIAFILLYFIMDLVIKMKNTNDDLLVKTLVYTDQSIVSNGIMKLLIDNKDDFNCNSLNINDKTITYEDDVIDIVSDYAEIGTKTCLKSINKIVVNIPISVKQLPDEDFSIDIDYRYGPNDETPPDISFNIEENNNSYYAVVTCTDEESGIVGDEETKYLLSGTTNQVIEHTCKNNADLETTESYEYKYSCVTYGSETCQTCGGGCIDYAELHSCCLIYDDHPDYPHCSLMGTCGGYCRAYEDTYRCNCSTPCNKFGFKM